jgi:hypothetical protein
VKSITFSYFNVGFLGIVMLVSYSALAQNAAQPEDFTKHTSLYDIAPAKTLFISEKKPETAAFMLTEMHDAQAKLGWRVFSVNPYQKNEDFRGFFVTYVKVGATE